MAFLAPVLTAAGGAVAGNLLNKLVNKIVGDAPMNSENAAELFNMMENPDTFRSRISTLQGVLEPSEMTQLISQPTVSLEAALNQSRGLLAPLINLPASSAASANSANLIRNHLSQSAADAAAVSQMMTNQDRTATNVGQTVVPQAMQTTPLDRAALAIRYQPQYLNSSNNGTLTNISQVNQPSVQTTNQQPTQSQLALQQQLQQLPPQATNSWTSTPVQLAAQPLAKVTSNQAVLTPNIATANTNPPSTVDTAKQVAASVGNTFLGTAKEAANAAINQVGNVVMREGSGALSKLIGKAASSAGSLISRGIGSLVSKIVGDAPVQGITERLGNDITFPTKLPTGLTSEFLYPIIAQTLPSGDQASTITAQSRDYPPSRNINIAKVVGDAPPTQVPTIPGMNINKIVGDAPPGGASTEVMPGMGETMTSDQVSAATNNLANSPAFAIISQLILEEQIMRLASGMPLGLNRFQINRQLGLQLEANASTFQQAQVNVVNGVQGSAFGPEHIKLYVRQTAAGAFVVEWLNTFNHQAIIMCNINAPKTAPPMGGNVTLDTLKPLLLGAASTEYSSQLRVRTSVLNVDEMMKAVAIASNNLEGQTGYSFALPLIKILGYVLDRMPIMGQNMSAYYAGVDFTFNAEATNDQLAWRPFPWILDYANPAGIEIAFSVLTETNFINAISGSVDTSDWDARFLPSEWGVTCALIFITQAEAADADLNLVRIASEVAYPFCLYSTRNTSNYEFIAAAAGGVPQFSSQPNANVWNNAMLTSIDGPASAVLFVVIHARDNQSVTVRIGPPSAEGIIYSINTLDNGPAQPDEQNAFNGPEIPRWMEWFGTAAATPSIMAWIRQWEEKFGNNSDRSTALRFWADVSRRYGPTCLAANDLHVGGAQASAGVSTVYRYYFDPDGVAQQDQVWTDTPAYMDNWYFNPAVDDATLEQFARAYLGLVKTATGLTGRAVFIGTTAERRVQFYNSASYTATLPATDYMIDYLVNRKWIYTMEEYPESSLQDPARVSLTIAVMNNILTSLVDLLCQTLDMTHFQFYVPGAIALDQVTRMRVERVFNPALEELIQIGIQFPTAQYNRMRHVYGANYPQGADNVLAPINLYRAIFGETPTTGETLASVARIPRELMACWAQIFLPMQNKLRLNFPAVVPSRMYFTVGAELLTLITIYLNTDDTKLNPTEAAILSRYVSRVSQGVVLTGVSANTAAFVRNKVRSELRLYLFNVRFYNESRNTMINYSVGRGLITLPSLTSMGIPKVENMMTRDYVLSFSPLSLVMANPLDAFGPGDGSYSYNMYYTMTGGYAALTTNSFTVVPESVFSNSGIQALLSSL